MGEKVLQVKKKGDKNLRVYAHCTARRSQNYQKGSVSLLMINLSQDEVLEIENPYLLQKKSAKLYSFSAPHLLSQSIDLNGKELTLERLKESSLGKNYMMKKFESLGPTTYQFLEIPEANHPDCV